MIGSHMLGIKRTLTDHETLTCCLGPTLWIILIQHLYDRWYIADKTDPEVVYYLSAWQRCDREQSWWLFMKSGPPRQKILSLNLFKVRYPTIFYALLIELSTWPSFWCSCTTFMVYIYLILRLYFRWGLSYFNKIRFLVSFRLYFGR